MSTDRKNGDQRLALHMASLHEALLKSGEPSVLADPELFAEFGSRLEEARQCLERLEALRREIAEETSEDDGVSTIDFCRQPFAEHNRSKFVADAASVRQQVPIVICTDAGSVGHDRGNLERLEQVICSTTVNESRGEIGRFKLLRALGAGSHGIVYLARDPVLERDVALKVPRPETLVSPDLRKRFLREARTVAELAHPNLVPVYEVGELGPVCFIASQYCSGPTLANWLTDQQRRVSVHLAVTLAKSLAETVDYVHQRGILHRDIKPANVLLTPLLKTIQPSQPIEPNPFPFELKLTDFGLAKLMDGSPNSTRTGAVLGTPAYMAPEQAEGRGNRISPATDVYALGVILYELLTGRPPFRGGSDLETIRQVTESRLISPRRLRREVPRDLEAVCLKCLEFEPDRRYQTAGNLAEDLRRFLAAEPVSARRAGPLLRLTKSFQRKPVVSTLVVSLALALVIGSSIVTWLWRRSEHNYKLAEASFRDSHLAIQEVHTVIYEGGKYNDPRFQPLRKELLETGLKYYRQLLARHSEDEAVLADAAGTLYEMGFISQSTGSKTKALETYDESRATWDSLIERNPTESRYQYYLAKTLNHMGLMQLETGKPDEAIASWRRSHEVWITLCANHPDDTGYQRELGYAYLALAGYDRSTQRWESMRLNSEAARRNFEKLSQQNPNNGELARMLAVSYSNIAYSHTQTGDHLKALEFLELSRDICEDLVRRQLDMPTSAKSLAQTLLAMGGVASSMNNPDLARRSFLRSNEILSELHQEHPATITYKRDLATSHWQLANLLRDGTNDVERRRHLLRSLVLRRELVQANPEVFGNLIDLERSLIDMAELSRDGGDGTNALSLVSEAEATCKKCPPDRRLWMDEIERLKGTLKRESSGGGS